MLSVSVSSAASLADWVEIVSPSRAILACLRASLGVTAHLHPFPGGAMFRSRPKIIAGDVDTAIRHAASVGCRYERFVDAPVADARMRKSEGNRDGSERQITKGPVNSRAAAKSAGWRRTAARHSGPLATHRVVHHGDRRRRPGSFGGAGVAVPPHAGCQPSGRGPINAHELPRPAGHVACRPTSWPRSTSH
jgi:hypothetical protein